jgi:hypothetical protein
MHKDPRPYDGPIARIDGAKPFNMYLWPMEGDWFWAGRDLGHCICSTWNFHVIALADRRWSTDMSVHNIEANDATPGWLTGERAPRRVVFQTRHEALRISAARMIRQARKSRRWNSNVGGLSDANCAKVIDWARAVVARESEDTAPRPIALRPLPQPKRLTGMPLFDCAEAST